MSAERRIPRFQYDIIGSPNYFRVGPIAFLFSLPLTISIIFANNKALLDWLCFGAFLLVDLILYIVIIYSISIIVPLLRQKNAWLKASVSVQTNLADRKMIVHEEEYGVVVDGWRLGLATIPPQLAVKSDESIVWVSVSKALYNRYANKSAIRIRYSTKDPFEFLLDDEI